jgi:hypothetical protein
MVSGVGSAKRTSSGGRAGRRRERAAFFTAPGDVAQRRYEALRAYFVDESTAAEVAARFGYAPSTVVAMVRDFTSQADEFFIERRPGPRVAPAKVAARDEVLRLRAAGHSVTEITQALAATQTPLNRTGVWELLVSEGHERLGPRAPGQRGAPTRDDPPRTRVMRWPEQPVRLDSDYAGALLLVPALVALDLAGAVAGAGLPGTREVPALCSVLSLLALKSIGRRRVSHVDDVCVDPALAAFAGLESLPKASSLGSYSYRLTRAHDQALLAGLARSMTETGQTRGADFDLDFHAIMHFGDDVALENHYVPPPFAAYRGRPVVLRPRQRDPQPALRQRDMHQGRPGRPSDRIRTPLGNRDRSSPVAAGVRLQSHHRRRARRTARRRSAVHHPARAHRQTHRHPGGIAR